MTALFTAIAVTIVAGIVSTINVELEKRHITEVA